MKSTHTNEKQAGFTIRATTRQKEIISRAARIKQVTVDEFMLETAYQAAHRVIAGQAHFALPEKEWKDFCRALDAPPKSIPKLKKLLTKPGVFDDERRTS